MLRVCWRGDPGRLERELLVAAHLPEGVPYPPVVAGGRDEALSWTVTRRLPGSALSGLWDALAPGQRRATISRHAQILQTLHAWQPPPAVSAAIRRRPPVDPADPATIVGADVNPLPVSRALLLVEAARRLPFVGFMEGRSTVLAWLEEDYPRLFAAPDLVQRLWLYQLAGTLRGLIVWPPRGPEDALRPWSAMWELRKLLGGAAHIDVLLGR